MKKKKILPTIAKDLKTYLQSEEGKIVEKKAAKLSLALIAAGGALSGVMNPADVQAQTCVAVPACNSCCPAHDHHASHSSHGSGGWC